MNNQSKIEKNELLKMIINESRHRPIVPFVGSGISISAGYPTIRLVTQYLAKVDFAIRFGVFQDRFPLVKGGKKNLVDHYRKHPSKYLEDFGWPNIGELDADLWRWLDENRMDDDQRISNLNEIKSEGHHWIWDESLKRHIKDRYPILSELLFNVLAIIESGNPIDYDSITEFIENSQNQINGSSINEKDPCQQIFELFKCINEGLLDKNNQNDNIKKLIDRLTEKNIGKTGHKNLIDLLSNDITKHPIRINGKEPCLELRDHLQAIVQWTLRQELAQREYGTARATLQEWLRWKKWHDDVDSPIKNSPQLLFGDWEMLLDKLCEGNPDLIDSLFNDLGNGLHPALSHRLLAFLQPKLGIPLILTTNFDFLLERALIEEGTNPKVFDIHRDADLPNAELVRRQFSVLKLHGSAYGLRYGERLKQRLETDTRTNALQYIPKNALILVLGFSGSERRMMQLLQAFAQNDISSSYKPKLIWVQGPSLPGPLFDELINCAAKNIKWCEIRHADTFLQELYFNIANSHQSSANNYSSLPGQLRMTELDLKLDKFPDINNKKKYRRPVQVFVADLNEKTSSGSWATLSGVAFVRSLDPSYTVIWIDLENHQTLESIIAEFFNRLRIIDPFAPICNISNFSNVKESFEQEIDKTIQRIREVFQRGRYVLVLDSLESFARPPMAHHGTPTYVYAGKQNLKDEYIRQIDHLHDFLSLLLRPENTTNENLYWDSFIVVTVDKPRRRHAAKFSISNSAQIHAIKKLIKLLKTLEISQLSDKSNVNYISQQISSGNNLTYKDFSSQDDLTILFAEDELLNCLPNHWQSKAYLEDDKILTNEERALERARGVLSLFDELRVVTNKTFDDNDEINAKNTVSAFICLLAFFRHPRTIPMVRSIIDRWALRPIKIDSEKDQPSEEQSDQAHTAITSLLNLIAPKDIVINEKLNNKPFSGNRLATIPQHWVSVFAQRHEGGSIWLYREIHEGTYDALTESLHAQEWIKFLKGENSVYSDETSVASIIDGLICISWHLFVARTYYVDVFMPTQDIKAFYEYLYHRVSAIRTITLLIAIIENSDWIILEEKIKKINHNSNSFEQFVNKVGIFDPIPDKDEKQFSVHDKALFLEQLRKLRRNSLETLLSALERNSPLFWAQSIPDIVMTWSSQFLDRELLEIEGLAFEGIKSQTDSETDIYFVIQDTKSTKIIDELKILFSKLLFRARMSKFDYKKILISERNQENTIEIIDEGTYLDRSIIDKKSNEIIDKCNEIIDKEISAFNKEKYHINYEPPKLNIKNKSTFYKIEEDTRNDLINYLITYIENENNNYEQVKEKLKIYSDKLLRIARCLLHLNYHDGYELAENILEELKKKIQENSSLFEYKKKLERDYITLKCKSLLAQLPFWMPLLERDLFEINTSNDKKLNAVLRDLQKVVNDSNSYEDTLRMTSKTRETDAKHRSSAFALRARALFLQGHFREAHHFLDIGSTGLLLERFDHRRNASIIHLVRAELLASSAHHHYFRCENNIKKMVNEVHASLKKIIRAEQELHHAEALLRTMAHENIWLIALEFGWAQIHLERILFEMELMFLEWPKLEETEYLKKSGVLEQSILNGLRRLRSVMEMIPYRSITWEDEIEVIKDDNNQSEVDEKYYPTLVKLERMSYILWKQFFVAGAFFTGLLSERYKNLIPLRDGQNILDNASDTIARLSGAAIKGDDADRFLDRWKQWCKAMRFPNLGNKVTFHLLLAQDEIPTPAGTVSLRAAAIQAMKKECTIEEINSMWNIRRNS